ncbi:MAG TPA: J domain-containing protein [Candidatus Limiplasma sp.]|nr:J domain-containing protein [Candidatus Limiplasma sp.]HRX09777.1 J domain-containing protein [Candidatus Limiplasma sp.]
MNIISIKRSLREMKRLEIKTRFGVEAPSRPPLVWDRFFDLQNEGRARYTLDVLAAMDREAYRAVIAEYWSFVYTAFMNENELHAASFDADVLLQWGLPADADVEAVKRRFRELAKRYHPDTGGNPKDFIRMMTEYRKLIGK